MPTEQREHQLNPWRRNNSQVHFQVTCTVPHNSYYCLMKWSQYLRLLVQNATPCVFANSYQYLGVSATSKFMEKIGWMEINVQLQGTAREPGGRTGRCSIKNVLEPSQSHCRSLAHSQSRSLFPFSAPAGCILFPRAPAVRCGSVSFV
jgi:hypothetical protein